MTIESKRHVSDSAPIHPASASSFAHAGRKDSAEVIEPTQKLVTVTQEKHIQQWQPRGNQADSQTILSPTYDLSVIVPTRNEQANIWPLLESLQNALRDLCVEIIFVDDSDD